MMAKHWSSWTQLMHDREERAAVRQMLAQAWDEGYRTCLGDFDITARRAARSANPYATQPTATEGDVEVYVSGYCETGTCDRCVQGPEFNLDGLMSAEECAHYCHIAQPSPTGDNS